MTSASALLLTLLVGISSVLGCIAVFVKTKDNQRLVAVSLAFAAGLTATVALSELLPEGIAMLGTGMDRVPATVGGIAMLLVGALLGSLVDRLAPHHDCHKKPGHSHHHGDEPCSNATLHRTGIAAAIGLALHNVPEGAALFISGKSSAMVGIAMGLVIVLHNIPEGMAISVPIYIATGSRAKAIGVTLGAGAMMAVGGAAAWLFLAPLIGSPFLGLVYGFVAGIMLYIALHELLPASFACNMRKLSLWAVLAGVCLVPLTHVFHH